MTTTTKFYFTVKPIAVEFTAFLRTNLRDTVATIHLEGVGEVTITHSHPAIGDVYKAFIRGLEVGSKIEF